MSKFDAIFKKIEENIGLAPQQNQPANNQQQKPATGTQPTPQQQKQALEQFAQAMGVDAAALQKAIETLKQQKPAAAPQQANKPVV